MVGCEPKPISELSAEDGIMRIRERHSEKSWENVVQDVNEYRARHPYSQYANEALLLQADAQYQSNRYPEALVGYEEFLQKNRSHPKLAMAAFRVAKCYDFQSSDEPDREQDVTQKAVQKFNEYLVLFPKGEDVAEARERLTLLRRRTADHELFIARFYWKREHWHAALGRYLDLRSSEYKDIRDESTQKAKEAYRELAKILEKDPKSDAVVWFKNKTPADLRKAADDL
jgi:outer membrane protein assembly factor BamD